MKEKEYIQELELFIKKLLEPIKDLPFSILVESLYGYKILSFDSTDEIIKECTPKLIDACIIACKKAYDKGIEAKRINEVGNYIESFMMDALNSVGFIATLPFAKDGSKKTAGYPDIYFELEKKASFYIECKTYNKKSIDQTFRTFYVSPSKNPKITKDAFHLMIGFEIDKEQRGDTTVYIPKHWKLYSLESLKGQIKHEFNASNKDLYSLETLIAEGDASKVIEKESTIDEFF